MRMLFLHHRRENNLGDLVSCPVLYFPFENLGDVVVGDIIDAANDPAHGFDVVVYGGGALVPRAIRHKTSAHKVLWGGGSTYRGVMEPHLSAHNSDGFWLYGARDACVGFGSFVPCASCMSPLFDLRYEVEHDVVYYGHSVYSPLDAYGPRMCNHGVDFAEVLAFLGSAETVVTSSYHGMYWAMLLGKKVVVIPFGSKFFQTPWPVRMFPSVPRNPGSMGVSVPGLLGQCRDLNDEFFLTFIGRVGDLKCASV